MKDNINKDELYFIMGWLLTELLKNVINHTKNIQNKDIERMPYPFWVDKDKKKLAINLVKNNIDKLLNNKEIEDNFINKINNYYKFI